MTGQCGQPGGYVAHLRRGEQACEPCLKARRNYMREWALAWADQHREPLAAVREVVRKARQISPSERALMYVADVELALGMDAPVPHKLGGNDGSEP